jgi:hypothetical protein
LTGNVTGPAASNIVDHISRPNSSVDVNGVQLTIAAQSVGLGSTSGTRGGNVSIIGGSGATRADAGSVGLQDGSGHFIVTVAQDSFTVADLSDVSSLQLTDTEFVVSETNGSDTAGLSVTPTAIQALINPGGGALTQSIVAPTLVELSSLDASANSASVGVIQGFLGSTIASEMNASDSGAAHNAQIIAALLSGHGVVTLSAVDPSSVLGEIRVQPTQLTEFVQDSSGNTGTVSVQSSSISETITVSGSATEAQLVVQVPFGAIPAIIGTVTDNGGSSVLINAEVNSGNPEFQIVSKVAGGVTASTFSILDGQGGFLTNAPGGGVFNDTITPVPFGTVPSSCLAIRNKYYWAGNLNTSGQKGSVTVPLTLPSSGNVTLARCELRGLIKCITAGTGVSAPSVGDVWTQEATLVFVNDGGVFTNIGGLVTGTAFTSLSLSNSTFTFVTASNLIQIQANANVGNTLGTCTCILFVDVFYC